MYGEMNYFWLEDRLDINQYAPTITQSHNIKCYVHANNWENETNTLLEYFGGYLNEEFSDGDLRERVHEVVCNCEQIELNDSCREMMLPLDFSRRCGVEKNFQSDLAYYFQNMINDFTHLSHQNLSNNDVKFVEEFLKISRILDKLITDTMNGNHKATAFLHFLKIYLQKPFKKYFSLKHNISEPYLRHMLNKKFLKRITGGNCCNLSLYTFSRRLEKNHLEFYIEVPCRYDFDYVKRVLRSHSNVFDARNDEAKSSFVINDSDFEYDSDDYTSDCCSQSSVTEADIALEPPKICLTYADDIVSEKCIQTKVTSYFGKQIIKDSSEQNNHDVDTASISPECSISASSNDLNITTRVPIETPRNCQENIIENSCVDEWSLLSDNELVQNIKFSQNDSPCEDTESMSHYSNTAPEQEITQASAEEHSLNSQIGIAIDQINSPLNDESQNDLTTNTDSGINSQVSDDYSVHVTTVENYCHDPSDDNDLSRDENGHISEQNDSISDIEQRISQMKIQLLRKIVKT